MKLYNGYMLYNNDYHIIISMTTNAIFAFIMFTAESNAVNLKEINT